MVKMAILYYVYFTIILNFFKIIIGGKIWTGKGTISKPHVFIHPIAGTSSTSLGKEQSRHDHPHLQGDEL